MKHLDAYKNGALSMKSDREIKVYEPVVCDHQHTRAVLAQAITRIYNHPAWPVCVARAAKLLQSILLPPARLEFDRDFDRRAVVEGADRLALLVGHLHLLSVNHTEVCECSGRDDVREVLGFFAESADFHEGERGPAGGRREIGEALMWG